MSEQEMSKSKLKREQRIADAKAAKNKKNLDTILTWVVGIIIAAIVIGVIVAGIFSSVNKVEASADFSEGITAEGYVKGAKLGNVDLSALNSLSIPYSEVEYTEEECKKQVEDILAQMATYETDSSLTVEDGSEINLDYVGSVDGVEFAGGNTNGNGANLTIGSKTFIDTFEEQLIGSHPGDHVTVNVTFPEEYENNTDLQGKAAVFECTINSIKVTPEYTDAFVAENLSEYASTTADFDAYVIKTGYEANVKNWIVDYINNNSTAEGAPKSYIKHLKAVLKYNDEEAYEYYNNYFTQMLGQPMYQSFAEYTGKTTEEYNDYLAETAAKTAAADITYEAYAKANGLTATEALVNDIIAKYGTQAESVFGMPYINQEALKLAVVNDLAEKVTVNK